jgi:hypothetical protein
MKKVFKNNGLSIVMLGIFVLLEIGLSFVGLKNYNNEQIDHGQNPVTYLEYIKSGSFMEATMDWKANLQMFAYILYQFFFTVHS